MTLRVLSYNIRYGGTGREELIAEVIRSCETDVVVFQEATNPRVVEKVAALARLRWCGAHPGRSLGFASRVELAHHAWHAVPFARRHYLELVLAHPHARIFGVHLSAIHSNPTELRRSYEVTQLLRGVAQHQHGLHVITGDFNTLAPGEELEFNKLPARLQGIIWLTGRKIRWVTIRRMLDGGYVDGYRLFHKDKGYTFPVWDPHVRLDYVFVPAGFASKLRRCEVITTAPRVKEASDHLPLLFELSLD